MNNLLPVFSCLSMLCLGTNAYAQSSCNLIVNGNFEKQNVASGRQLDGRVSNVLNTLTNLDELANWQSTTFGTPDYFAKNAAYGSNTNPATTTYFGTFTPFQPASGADNGGTLGLISYPNNSPVGGEYVTQTLTSSLRSDRSYYASMQVQRASGAAVAGYVGMYVTVADPKSYNTLRYYSPSAPPAGCGIQSSTPVTSTSWTRVSNVFAGVAGAKYVNIGNFTSNSNPNNNNDFAYNHIDEVELYQIPTAGSSVTSCSGVAVALGEGCHIPGATYSWSAPGVGTFATSSSNPQIRVNPTSTTTYTLTVALPDGTHSFSSSATITVNAAPTIYGASFYIMRYEGCRKYYGISMEAVANTAQYRYTASVTISDGGGGSAVGVYDPSTNRVTFPLDIQVIYGGATATATITVTGSGAGACNQSSTFTQFLSGIDPGCVDPGDGGGTMTRSSTSYPNPASESLTVAEDIEEATLFDGRGKEVQKASKSHKLDVRSLPEGLYDLRMLRKGKVINQRIQVKH
jgi:hypothetical protein